MEPISDPPPDPLATLAGIVGLLALTTAIAVALVRHAGRSLQLGIFGLSCLGVLLGLASLGRNLRGGRPALPIIALALSAAAVFVSAVFFVVH